MIESTEFDRQVNNLVEKGYPPLAHLSHDEFIHVLTPLKEKLKDVSLSTLNIDKGTLPFVIVVKNSLIPAEKMMEQVVRDGKHGFTKLFPHDTTDFSVTHISLPESPVYLLIDIDRGKESLNIRPQDALLTIQNQKRTPLTIDEGIALITQYPEFLIKNNCYSLLASRHKGDQRVPAIWINGAKHPNLGWCWDGNPHTWLGSASCKDRIGY